MTRPSGTAISAAIMKPSRIRRQLSVTWLKNFGSPAARIGAVKNLLRRGHVEEADIDVDAVGGQQMPGDQKKQQRYEADRRPREPAAISSRSQRRTAERARRFRRARRSTMALGSGCQGQARCRPRSASAETELRAICCKSPSDGFQRIREADDLATILGRRRLRHPSSAEKARSRPCRCHRVEGLIGEQLDAAFGIEDVGDVNLLALALQLGKSAECAGRAVNRA